jgi:hypothetical protein
MAILILLQVLTQLTMAEVSPLIIKASHWPRRKSHTFKLITQGSKFFYQTNGTQFFVRGMIYEQHQNFQERQTVSLDSISDGLICARDVPLLLKLGVNTIITSGFLTPADHSACMRIFEEAEIYVIALINGNIDTGIRVNGTVWKFLDYATYDAYFKIVDSLASYSNLLGFMVDLTDHRADRLVFLPRFKAYVRDIKEHLGYRSHRTIPVGAYGFNHGKSTMISQYMSCGGTEVAADFYVLTSSRSLALKGIFWCANSSVPYDRLADQYRNYPLPVIITYGCDANISHTFQEPRYIYTGAPGEVFSGGVTDDWFQDKLGPSDAGTIISRMICGYILTLIGVVETNGKDIKPGAGYAVLSLHLATAKPTPVQIEDYSPSNTASPCQDITVRGDLDSYAEGIHGQIKISTILPSRPSRRVCSCMMENINCISNPMATMEDTFISRKKICDDDPSMCSGIAFNSTEGRFGSFLMCNLTENASWAQQQNYRAHNNDSAACTSAGGIIQQATPLASMASDCQVLLPQAGSDGQGTITFTPTSAPTGRNTQVAFDTGDLYTGTKVGIGVGMSLFTILSLVLGIFLWARRRRKRAALLSQEDEFRKAELADTSSPRTDQAPVLIDSNEVKELPGADALVEKEGDQGEIHANKALIIELPTPYNERAELEVSPISGKS